jgi:hypothetical protein
MQAANVTDSKLIVLSHPQEKKPSSRSSQKTGSAIRFSEALAKCKLQDDLVPGLCELAGLPASYRSLEQTWPWLKNRVEVPCGCEVVHPTALITLCHLFDRHVTDLKDWSLSELVEWTTRTQARQSGDLVIGRIG